MILIIIMVNLILVISTILFKVNTHLDMGVLVTTVGPTLLDDIYVK